MGQMIWYRTNFRNVGYFRWWCSWIYA